MIWHYLILAYKTVLFVLGVYLFTVGVLSQFSEKCRCRLSRHLIVSLLTEWMDENADSRASMQNTISVMTIAGFLVSTVTVSLLIFSWLE